MTRSLNAFRPPRALPVPLVATLLMAGLGAQTEPLPATAFGPFSPVPGEPGAYAIGLPVRDAESRLKLPTPFPHIVRASLGGAPTPLVFNEDASEIGLELPGGAPASLRLEVSEGSQQFADGRIVFSALDATVNGAKAKLESHPGNHRIGFWSDPADTVSWDYKASRPGMYDVALTYSLASGTSEVQVAYGAAAVESKLDATGSWYRYTTVAAGRVYLEKSGKVKLEVTPISKTGGAVMNLKAVLLTPAPEGDEIVQDGDSITLRSQDATTHGVKMRYEPQPHKNCLGYWANPADWASWSFTAKQAGSYRVKLTQGCGKGHGGSVVNVLLGGQQLEFTVVDTGGFQNWKELDLGAVEIDAPGQHTLEVRPVSKPGVAVMDIRKIVLAKESP